MFLGKANVASRLSTEEGEAISLEGVRRGLSGSHLPRPPIRWRQVHRQAEPLQWHQKEQTLEDSHGEQDPWGRGKSCWMWDLG